MFPGAENIKKKSSDGISSLEIDLLLFSQKVFCQVYASCVGRKLSKFFGLNFFLAQV